MGSVSALAVGAGVNVQTARYYGRRGLIAAPPRTASGDWQYAPETAERSRCIKGLQELGFTLDEIRELLEAKMRRLGRLKRVLERLARACERRTPTAECPSLEVVTDASHDAVGAVIYP